MRAHWGGDRQTYLLASRQSCEVFGRVLAADVEAIGADSVLAEWEQPTRPTGP